MGDVALRVSRLVTLDSPLKEPNVSLLLFRALSSSLTATFFCPIFFSSNQHTECSSLRMNPTSFTSELVIFRVVKNLWSDPLQVNFTID